jgi:c-di-GMP-binding flagellar brake protein YcgR
MDDSWRYILDKFRIVAPSEDTLYYYYIFGVFVIFVLVLWDILLSSRRKKRLLAFEWDWFHRIAEARDLSEEEAEIMIELARDYIPKEPHKIVQSIRLFDSTAKKYLQSSKQEQNNKTTGDIEEIIDSAREKLFLKEFHSQDNLQSTRQIPPQQKIRVTVPVEKGRRFLHATVTKNTRKHIMLYDDSFHAHKHLFIPGAHFTGYYWRERDAGYQFPLIVASKEKNNEVMFNHSEEFLRKQRRHFFRVRMTFTGRFYVLSEEEADYFILNESFQDKTNSGNFLGKVANLSGGGMSFFTDRTLETDCYIRIELIVTKGQTYKGILGRIVRIDTMEDRFKVFVDFVTVHDKTREAIIHLISKKQQVKKNDET